MGSKTFIKLFGKWEKKLYASVDSFANRNLQKNKFEILEFEKGEWEEPLFHYHLPKVFRGAAKDWPCTNNWDFNYFIDQYGDHEVTPINNPGLTGRKTDQDYDVMTLRNFIEGLKRGSRRYLKFSQLVQDTSELKSDFDYEWLKKFKSAFSFGDIFYFFIGGKDTITPVHNGFSRTIFVQAKGSKKWVFYAPEERIFMGVKPERLNYYYTDADPYNLSDPKFPLLKHAKKYEVTINEGDVLFIPPHVWHQVENITDTIGIAYKFADIPSSFRSSKILSFLYFFSTKPYVFNSTAHFKKDENSIGKNKNAYS